jgi:hypothetical protein
MLKKMSRLTVHSVGDTVTTIKSGDVVLVEPMKLRDAPVIDVSDDMQLLLMSPFDVILIW